MTTHSLTVHFQKDKHLKRCKEKQANVFICVYVEFVPSAEMSGTSLSLNANGQPAVSYVQINDDSASRSVR